MTKKTVLNLENLHSKQHSSDTTRVRGQPHEMRSGYLGYSWMCEKNPEKLYISIFFSGDGLFGNWLNTIVRRSRD